MSEGAAAVAVIRRLPIVANSFDGIDGSRPWIGPPGDRALVGLARAVAAERGAGGIVHVGARDGMTTVGLGQTARSTGAAVLAVDPWVPGPLEWTAEAPAGFSDVAPPDRLRSSFLHALVRERLGRAVTPLQADVVALCGIARSRGLRFDLVVWSATAGYRTQAIAAAELDLLLDLLGEEGVLVAKLPVAWRLDQRLAGWAGEAGRSLRIGEMLVGSRRPLPESLSAKLPRRPPPAERRFAGRAVLRAADIRTSLDELDRLGTAALVMSEPFEPLVPRILLAEDWTGTGEVERRLLAHKPEPGIELFVAPGGICGVERRVVSGDTLGLSLADADGRPFVDEAPDGAVLMHDRLQARGLIDFEDGETIVRTPAPVRQVDGTLFVAASFNNYFHWHNDVLGWLPYVLDVQRRLGSGPIRLATPAPLNAWSRRSLELIGIGPDNYLEIKPGTVLQATEVLIGQPRHATVTPRRAGEAFAMLRDGLGVRAGGDRRIWISRADVGIRGVGNEEALRPELERRGFEIAALGRIGYDEKIRMFAGASVAAGPHGAGFTHAGFMAPGGAVAELFTSSRVRRYIPRLAAAYGLGYGYLCLPYAPNPARSFDADPDRLLPALDRLVAAQAALASTGSRGGSTVSR